MVFVCPTGFLLVSFCFANIALLDTNRLNCSDIHNSMWNRFSVAAVDKFMDHHTCCKLEMAELHYKCHEFEAHPERLIGIFSIFKFLLLSFFKLILSVIVLFRIFGLLYGSFSYQFLIRELCLLKSILGTRL